MRVPDMDGMARLSHNYDGETHRDMVFAHNAASAAAQRRKEQRCTMTKLPTTTGERPVRLYKDEIPPRPFKEQSDIGACLYDELVRTCFRAPGKGRLMVRPCWVWQADVTEHAIRRRFVLFGLRATPESGARILRVLRARLGEPGMPQNMNWTIPIRHGRVCMIRNEMKPAMLKLLEMIEGGLFEPSYNPTLEWW